MKIRPTVFWKMTPFIGWMFIDIPDKGSLQISEQNSKPNVEKCFHVNGGKRDQNNGF
jgi:hypothetical protein